MTTYPLRVMFAVLAILASAANAAELSGTVSNADGSPAAGAVVYALDADASLSIHNNTIMNGERAPRAITGRDGHFVFDELAAPPALLLAQDMDDALAMVDVASTKSPVAITIERQAQATVVVKNGPLAVANEEVRYRLQTPVKRLMFEYTAITGAEGIAQPPPLMPGRYEVTTWQSVPQVGCCFRAVMTRYLESQVEPGAQKQLVWGDTEHPYLEGVVSDTGGNPLHGVWVRLIPTSQPDIKAVWSTVTDADGRYAIYDVHAGEYELRCFRRLALNDGSRTLEAVEPITLANNGPRTRNAHDIVIDLEPFLPLVAGADAPPIDHDTVDGAHFTLADHRGEWVLLHFFASWCAPCVATIGSYDAIAADLDGAPLTVVGLSLDESLPDLTAFLAEHTLEHPVVYAGSWSQNPIREAYRVVNIPTTVLIDPEGKIDQIDAHGEVLKDYLKDHLVLASGSR